MTMPGAQRGALGVLREYQSLAPWNIRDFSIVAGAILDDAGIRPTSGAASFQPRARTIRFYVTKGLLDPPTGRGASATYHYRHLIQLLSIKLRQMEGATLEQIARETATQTGDAIERHVANQLGAGLRPPSALPLGEGSTGARGRAGRAFHLWHREAEVGDPADDSLSARTRWHRFALGRGLELHVHEGHPLADRLGDGAKLSTAIRAAIQRVLTGT